MYTFLILCSSAVAFYLLLLIALYRDSRRRRAHSSSFLKTEVGSMLELGEDLPLTGVALVGQNLDWFDNAFLVPVTTSQGKSKSRGTLDYRAKVVYLTKPGTTKDRLRFG